MPDLSALDGFDIGELGSKGVTSPAVQSGRAAFASRDKFKPDPNQPRRKFNLEELAASVKADGRIKIPLIVSSPDADGIMMLRDGERRWRVSEMVGIDLLPYVIDDDFDKLSQLIVNMQREDNTPDEKAATILELEAMGMKRSEIARRLGKSAAFVTELADFAKLPPDLRAVYDQERCTDVTLLNLLRRLSAKHAEGVASFIADPGVEITRSAVNALAESLKRSNQPAVNDGDDDVEAAGESDAESDEHERPEKREPKDPGERFKRPVVHVSWSGKAAVLLVNRRGTAPGKVWIKLEDGKEREVRFSSVQNVEITEG